MAGSSSYNNSNEGSNGNMYPSEGTVRKQAPKILATGKGHLADKIIEKAKESDVPTYEDSKLANTLSNLEIGDMIPPELYTVVAEILVFVDRTDKLRGKIHG